MKRNVLIVVVFLGLAGLWRYSQTGLSAINNKPGSIAEKQINILIDDKEKLEKNIKPNNLLNAKWSEVNNYARSARDIVNKDNSREYFKLTTSTVADLVSCLKKDFCGMEKRNENDAYFDETKTPGHILLGRNLELMLEVLRINPELKKDIDWDLIEELTESENEKIQVQALELLKNYNDKNNETEKLLKMAENFKGNAKANALEELSGRNSKKDRKELSLAIEKSFAEDDPNTVISVVEKLKKMRLTETEVTKVSKNLCRFKEAGSDDPNWKMLKYNMLGLTDLDNICN